MGEQTYATQNYAYGALLSDFDGAAVGDALYFPSGLRIAGIQIGIDPNNGTAGLLSVPFYLEYIAGSTWGGSSWTPGTWTPWYSGVIKAACVSASNIMYEGPNHYEFEPPMRQPEASRELIRAPSGHSKAGQMIVPNTGSSTEVAGRFDSRLVFDAPNVGTAANWIAYVNIQVVTQG